ncbi:MAG: DUF3617 domain-containing protein [Erythrobacter sp.]|uniref:DUF3617 domain-containing protein n=1 Tax=Erythrobacter sp. TaxID=1042 RepID=UPI00261034C8|nr:DUF3617 domain-containing protein [Erythrobacter sp.]MDJ0978731.1 DUF3617 domain-containing protein [Erythrobacter sp.]
MRIWLASAAALLGAGAVIAQTIDEEMKPLPGQYQSRLELISAEIPGMPANMTEMMKGMLERSITICVTPEEVEEGYKEALRKSQDGECRYNSFTATGGRIEAEMVCSTDMGEMTMVMSGTGSPTASDVTMQMTGEMGGGPGSMTMRVRQNRLGDC